MEMQCRLLLSQQLTNKTGLTFWLNFLLPRIWVISLGYVPTFIFIAQQLTMGCGSSKNQRRRNPNPEQRTQKKELEHHIYKDFENKPDQAEDQYSEQIHLQFDSQPNERKPLQINILGCKDRKDSIPRKYSQDTLDKSRKNQLQEEIDNKPRGKSGFSTPQPKHETNQDHGIQVEYRSLQKKYTLIKLLKIGENSCVYIIQENETKLNRVAKCIKKNGENPHPKRDPRKDFINEVYSLRDVEHPHIASMFDYFEDDKFYYIIKEYCDGGQIEERIVIKKKFSEHDASLILKDILSTLIYLHSHHIYHLGISSQNMVYSANFLKFVDFTHSQKKQIVTKFHIDNYDFSMLHYMAPEVVATDYDADKVITEKSDIWSCGVLLYFLLSGTLPFYGQTKQDLVTNILEGDLKFNHKVWHNISQEAQELCSKLLSRDKKQRPKASTALHNPWFEQSNNEKMKANLEQTVQILREITQTSILQHGAQMYIAKNMISQEVKSDAMLSFKELDVNHDGVLSKDELVQAMKQNSSQDCEHLNDIDHLFKVLDRDRSGNIDITEFMAGAVDRHEILQKRNINATFNILDTVFFFQIQDKNGKLSKKEIINFLKSLKFQKINEDLFEQIDLNHDGHISRKEFAILMKSVSESVEKQ